MPQSLADEFIFSPPPLGCVLWLPGLPGAGSTIYDRSPYGNNGTITGAVWKFQNGLWYLDFDGTDDLVTIADAPSLSALSKLTIEFWGKSNSQLNYMAWINKWASGATEWILHADVTDDQLRFFIYSTVGTIYLGSIFTAAIYNNVWHHIVAVWDGSLTAGNGVGLFVYIDGQVATYVSDGSVGTFVSVPDTTTPVTLGEQTGLARDLTGSMALPRLYNTNLSLLTAQNHYQQERHLFGV